jgi:ubiquinone/menaquinone biosynthesis C-methylase UbiE
MAMAKKQPIAQDAYSELAEAYAASVDTKPHNAYYERPATLSLLPDVKGKHVLDAGCGPGVYSEWLVAHGGIVVAIDANEKMVGLARQRLGEKVQVLQANLEAPLDFLVDASFDIIVCPLVMDYIKEWEPTFKEFHRILRAQGCLVFSMEHPYMKYATHHLMSNYFKVERVEYIWRGFGKPVNVPSYRRPLSGVINPLLQAGFILEQILEPLPIEEFYEKDPEDYDELMRSPGFMCVKASKA